MSTSAPPLTGSPLDLLRTRPTVSVAQAAEILSISRGQAYAMASEGALRVLRIGSRLVVPTDQLRELIDGPAADLAEPSRPEPSRPTRTRSQRIARKAS